MREHKRSGLIETKRLSKIIRDNGGRLLETMGDYEREQETDRDCKRLSETIRDYGRLRETIRDYERALETDRDCKRLSETIRDYGRL